MRNVAFLICSIILLGCPKPYTPPKPECADLCDGIDYSKMRISTKDVVPIFVKYSYANNGNYIIPNTGMTSLMQPVSNTLSQEILIRNDLYNHIYFYSDASFTNEIGKLIFLNTQPVFTKFCEVGVRINGNYTPEESRISIRKTGTSFCCIRQAQLSDWHIWDLEYPTSGQSFDQDAKCATNVLNSSPANLFNHIYFYESKCPEVNENKNLSKIILLNTKSEKINLHSIVFRK